MANGVSKAFPVRVEGFTGYAPTLHVVGPSDGERSGPGNADDLQTIFTHGPDGQSAIRGGFRDPQPVTTAVQVGVVRAAEVIHTVRSGQRGGAEQFAILSESSPASGRQVEVRSGKSVSPAIRAFRLWTQQRRRHGHRGGRNSCPPNTPVLTWVVIKPELKAAGVFDK